MLRILGLMALLVLSQNAFSVKCDSNWTASDLARNGCTFRIDSSLNVFNKGGGRTFKLPANTRLTFNGFANGRLSFAVNTTNGLQTFYLNKNGFTKWFPNCGKATPLGRQKTDLTEISTALNQKVKKQKSGGQKYPVNVDTSKSTLSNGGTCRKNMSEFDCLVCNCYFEARGENQDDQKGVVKTSISRARHKGWRRTMCGVVWQDNIPSSPNNAQFSWTDDGNSDRVREIGAVRRCINSTKLAIDEMKSIWIWKLYFHTPRVNPKWNRNCTGRQEIGGHIYYYDC